MLIENFNIVIQQSNLTVMTHYEELVKRAERVQRVQPYIATLLFKQQDFVSYHLYSFALCLDSTK